MRGITMPLATLGLVAVFAGSGLGAVAAQDPGKPLEGIWVLNEDLSEDPPPVAARDGSEARRGRGQSAGGGAGRPGRGGGGFSGGRGGGGGQSADRPDPKVMAELREATQAAIADLMSAPRRITIVATEQEVLLTYDDGRVVRLIPDDREHAGIAGTALEVTRRTTWNGAQLVTQIELQSRTTLELQQTYDVNPEGQQLVIASRFEDERSRGDDDREFRRVYEREAR